MGRPRKKIESPRVQAHAGSKEVIAQAFGGPERKEVHADYNDLKAPVSVYIPATQQVVDLPSSRAAVASMCLIPAVMLHEILLGTIMQIRRSILETGALPDPKLLTDLIKSLSESNKVMRGAWDIADSQDGDKMTGSTIVNNIVNISSDILGSDPRKVNLKDVIGKLRAVEIDIQEFNTKVDSAIREEAQKVNTLEVAALESEIGQQDAETEAQGIL